MLDEALKMLKELRNGWTFSETEIVEMIDGLRERGKELEHKDKLDLFEALEEKSVGILWTSWKSLFKDELNENIVTLW